MDAQLYQCCEDKDCNVQQDLGSCIMAVRGMASVSAEEVWDQLGDAYS